MRRVSAVILSLVLLSISSTAFADQPKRSLSLAAFFEQPQLQDSSDSDWEPPFEFGLRAKRLHRLSTVWDDEFIQLALDLNISPALNFSIGYESFVKEVGMHSYFLAYEYQWGLHHACILRLNHIEYPDWWVGLNVLNALYEYDGRHWYAAVGLSYSALLFGEGEYKDGLLLESDLNEFRLVYSVAYERLFINDRLGFKVGTNNINEFEVFAYEQLGLFVEPIIRLTDHIFLRANFEARFTGAVISVPQIGRVSWFVGLSWE